MQGMHTFTPTPFQQAILLTMQTLGWIIFKGLQLELHHKEASSTVLILA